MRGMLRVMLGVMVAVALVGCQSKKERTDQDIVDEVTAVTTKALTAWDAKPLNDLFTEGKEREAAKDEDTKAFSEGKAKFGALKSLGKGELRARDGADTSMNQVATPMVRYSSAEFEKGPATVEVWIRAKRESLEWRVDHYKVVPRS